MAAESEPVPIQAFTTRFPRDEYEALRAYAFFAGSTINDTVKRAVRLYLAEHVTEDEVAAMLERQRAQFHRTVDGMKPEKWPARR